MGIKPGHLQQLFQRAKSSKLARYALNRALSNLVPFNRSHRIEISKVGDSWVQVSIPYARQNLNHLKGLHACALATACEFSTGVCLFMQLDPATYRLIMRSLEIDYFYQGKTDALATCQLTPEWIAERVQQPLSHQQEILVTTEAEAFDDQQPLLCRARISWQIKEWANLKTKI